MVVPVKFWVQVLVPWFRVRAASRSSVSSKSMKSRESAPILILDQVRVPEPLLVRTVLAPPWEAGQE